MNKRQMVKIIDEAHDAVLKRISDQTNQSELYSRGLASEGYLGGYAQALQDVLLLSNGVRPRTRYLWEDIKGFENDENIRTN